MALGSQSLAGGVNGAGRNIDVVLFDVGGVIVRLDDFVKLGPLNGQTQAQAIKDIWGRCPVVRAHETGRLTADAFAARMVETYAMDCAPGEFLERFCAWPREIFDGVEAMLGDLDPAVEIACLSNTCDIHWRTQVASADLARLFKRQFLSYELGLMKPDADIYLHVARELGFPPDRILFFDDSRANVDGALAVGIDAHLVEGPEAARMILDSYGLLRGGKTSSGST